MQQKPDKHRPTLEKLQALFKYTPFLAVTLLAGIEAQAEKQIPRMVVNIAIDGLRSDLLDAFMPLYGESGFKRLFEDGRVYSCSQYPNDNLNRASSIATLATGAVPYDHGIIDLQWFDRNTLRPLYCVADDTVSGLGTTEKLSPKNLVVSTIGDELKVATEGKALVYAFAPFSDAAILSAGHAADGAFWIDRQNGLWAGSNYYSTSLPAWVEMANRNALPTILPSTTWTPCSELSGNFCYFLSGGLKEPFSHKFKGDHAYSAFITSAMVNEYVCSLARQCIKYTTIGLDDTPDYIAITLYAGGYDNKPLTECAMETQDAYVRLDKVIADLIKETDEKIGAGNTLFVVTSTGVADEENDDLSKYRIPSGNFYINRTANLINMMLMAIYGQGNYVEATYDNQIYLNHKLITDKQLNYNEVLDRCQELLLQSQGVKDAYSSQRLLLGAWTPGINKIRNSYNPRLSGDILVKVAPGWRLVNETHSQNRLVRESYLNFPIFFYGLNVKKETVETPVTTDCIAATLATIMRIRAPNACHTASQNIY
ncbi:MAG: alkaline phosphatase family protein [Bacteroidaceae bacterium]|nr:alkaline phosphatase family protein [Bacteroidaceae bacterium]